MAQITLSNPIFYRAGQSGMSTVVGVENRMARIVRYDCYAPSVGASTISLDFTGFSHGGGTTPSRLRAYIGTDPNSHANAGPSSSYTCILTNTGRAYTGQANMVLLPGAHYYVWVFPDADPATSFGWVFWSTRAGSALMTTGGAAATVISGSSGTLGQSNTLSLSRYTAEATHTLTASCVSASMTIAQNMAADTYSWTPPIAWATQNTTGTSVSVTVTCTTYIDAQEVGASTVTLTMAIPESIIPTCTMSHDDPTGLGFIQHQSQLHVTLSAQGVYGSTITLREVVFGGRRTAVDDKGITYDLPEAGVFDITGIVTDSRGRHGSVGLKVGVHSYAAPTAVIRSVYRCNAEGNEDLQADHVCVLFDATVDTSTADSAEYAVKQRVRGTTNWTATQLPQYSGNPQLRDVTVILPADKAKSFDFCIEVSDKFTKNKESAYRSCSAASAWLHVKPEHRAMGIGQIAEVPGAVSFGLPARLNFGVQCLDIYIASWEMADTVLQQAMADIPDRSIGYFTATVSGNVWHCTLYKTHSRYATAEFVSYSGRKRKRLLDGVWQPIEDIPRYPTFRESAEYPGHFYQRTNSGEYEWLNPPMVPGESYRTIRRYKERPVYTYMTSQAFHTSLGNPSGYYDIMMPVNMPGFEEPVQAVATIDGYYLLPYLSSGGGMTVLDDVTSIQARIRIYQETWDSPTLALTVDYLKVGVQ